MTEHITDYHAALLGQFLALKNFPMFARMARTVEGSKWHREATVLVHTEMVVDDYIARINELHSTPNSAWTRRDYLGGLACVFHDTGKPECEVEKFKPERGNYRAYHGHELASARIWEDYAARDGSFTGEEITLVSFLIEYHKPWEITDQDKLTRIVNTALAHGCITQLPCAFLADQNGRLSDNKEENFAACQEWMDNLMNIAGNFPTFKAEGQPTLYMPIAPSGAGKSTYLKKLQESESALAVFSLDTLRHEFYDPNDYAKAYEGSVKDKSFEARANARFHAMVKEHKSLYIDNTNLSAKRRAFYLKTAKKHGYHTVAVLMPVELNVVLRRQHTRADKSVPKDAVIRQYKSLQQPLIGEFDEIVVSNHNLTASNHEQQSV